MNALSTTVLSSVKALSANWQNLTSAPDLNNTTHIWAIELHRSPAYINTLKSWLTKREIDRAQRIVIPYKRNHQIQSRAWLRWLLAHYTNSNPKNIHYKYGELGKPYLDSGKDDIQFNATDSGNTLLIALHQSNMLGLDIEAVPRKVNGLRIAQKKLTQQEFRALSKIPEKDQSNAFLALWTRKESYGKAIGLGIRYPMNKVHLCDDLAEDYFQFRDSHNQRWHLQQFAGKNFIACLTSSQRADKVNFYKLDVDSLALANV